MSSAWWSGRTESATNPLPPPRVPTLSKLKMTFTFTLSRLAHADSQLDDSAAQGDCDGLRAIGRPQLLHDVLDVDLDRFLGDEEALRDVAVAVAARDVAEHLDLPAGQGLVAHVLREM